MSRSRAVETSRTAPPDARRPSPKPAVAVIVLNWNGWRDTVSCLDALERLEYPRREVIVVDNGSTDGSVDHIRAVFPTVRLLEAGANLGFSGGCNLGIRDALDCGFDYVWLINNDAKADPTALSALVETAEADPRIGATGSVIYHMDRPDTVQEWGGGRVNLWSGRMRIMTAPSDLNYLSGCSLLIHSGVLRRTGLLDERFFLYWEDIDLCRRLLRLDYRLAVAPESRVYHRGSASMGRGSTLQAFYFHRAATLFYRLHTPLPIMPTTALLVRRTIRWILKRRLANIPATWRGVWAGWRA
ncbi:MAG TPA: glycosyltransferase family 2 protein [Gammaproteobacteria bacterium]|nr:glycosyltransferase family 2 protein [Gammaproteobacteria bacterium]